eukprot:352787_1
MHWNGLFGENRQVQQIQLYFCIVVGIHHIAVLFYQMRVTFRRQKARKTPILSIEWIVLITLFVGLLFPVLFTALHLINTTSDTVCHIMTKSIITTALLSKFMFELFVLERLFLIIKSPPNCLRIVPVSWVVVAVVVTFNYSDIYYDDSIQLCGWQISTPSLITRILVFCSDAIICVTFAVLFARKLNVLDVEMNVTHLLRKCMILSLFGIVSSFVSYPV